MGSTVELGCCSHCSGLQLVRSVIATGGAAGCPQLLIAWAVGRVLFGYEALRTSSALYGEVLAATGTYLAA
eukprot:1349475-Prymnesium_polylepis.1